MKMEKKVASFASLLLLLLVTFAQVGSAHNVTIPNPGIIINDTVGEPESLDPAWAYDTSSGEVIQQVYETLVFYKTDWMLGPYNSGLTDQFIPVLAASVPTGYRTTGLQADKVAALDFTIALGHRFSDGNMVTAQDVEYSFERMLVQDRDGGPQWMLYRPLLGVNGANVTDPTFGSKIDASVESSGNNVTFYFSLNFSLKVWLQILSGSLGSIVEKLWAVAAGDFDGNFSATWSSIATKWHNPPESFLDKLDNPMMGSGPYKFNYWSYGVAYSVTRNVNYWQGWPAPVAPGSADRLHSYIDTVVWNEIISWTARRTRFLAGNSDITIVPRVYRNQILNQPGIRVYYPLPTFEVSTTIFFNLNIAPSVFAYWNPPGVFTETGLPPDVFSDVNVRRGFAYAFDYKSYLANGYLGDGEQPATLIIPGLAYSNPAAAKYSFNMTLAKEYLQQAWGGALWANGMTFVIPYFTRDIALVMALTMLAANITSLNPKFHVQAEGNWISLPVSGLPPPIEWPIMGGGPFPSGWIGDYADPDGFAFPFMHSQGLFTQLQRYVAGPVKNPDVDPLVQYGAALPDDTQPYDGSLDLPNPYVAINNQSSLASIGHPEIKIDSRWPRRSVYYELQRIYYTDVPSITIAQPVERHFERDWVRGFYYNPMYPGLDYYHMWKAVTHFGDVNNDGHVDVSDLAYVSAHFTAAGLPYNIAADINGGLGGLTGKEYQRGMPDGVVDIADFALLSAYWDGPPQGPAHP